MVKFWILNRENGILIQPNIKKVKFGIINLEKSIPNQTQYKKELSIVLLILKNEILIEPNIRKGQGLDF
jgi:hypothetical protein